MGPWSFTQVQPPACQLKLNYVFICGILCCIACGAYSARLLAQPLGSSLSPNVCFPALPCALLRKRWRITQQECAARVSDM
jgi:hypothetical protein